MGQTVSRYVTRQHAKSLPSYAVERSAQVPSQQALHMCKHACICTGDEPELRRSTGASNLSLTQTLQLHHLQTLPATLPSEQRRAASQRTNTKDNANKLLLRTLWKGMCVFQNA